MKNDPFFEDDALPPNLSQVAERYKAQPVPRPGAETTARLVALLLSEDPALRDYPIATTARLQRIVPVIRWRMHLLGPWFWVASVCLFGLAAILTPQLGSPTGLSPLILIAPLTMILGVVHGLRARFGGLRAVEQSCPVNFIETSAALVGTIAIFDILIGMIGSLGLALLHWAPFDSLVIAWLSPLLLFTGLSLPIALRWGTRSALLVGGGPWLLLAVVAVLNPTSAVTQIFALPQTLLSLVIHLTAAAVGLIAILLVFLSGSSKRTFSYERFL